MPPTRSQDRLAGAPVEDETSWERSTPGRGVALAVAIALALVVGLAARGAAPSDPATPPTHVRVQRSAEVLEPPAVAAGALPTSRNGARSDAWAHLSDLPVGHVVAAPVRAVDGRVVVLGARDGRVALAAMEVRRADGDGPTWELLPASPLRARSGPLLELVDGGDQLVVWGGRAGADGHGAVLGDGALLDLDTGAWAPVPPLPGPPGTPPIGTVRDAALVDGRLMLVGGAGPGLGRSRPVAWTWQPGDRGWMPLPAPPVDALHAVDVVAVGDRLAATIVIRDEGTRWGDVVTLSYDVDDGRWHEHEVVPLQRQHRAAAVALDDRRVAVWGRPSTAGVGSTADGLVLDHASGTWWRLPPPPTSSVRDPAALSADAAASGGDLIVISDGLAHVLRHDIDERTWSVLAPTPSQGAVGRLAVADGRLVWWGRHPDGAVTVSVLREPIAQGAGSRASAASHAAASPAGW